jgi:cytosine/adenosine deaminase-related metal-dependent hydrolase
MPITPGAGRLAADSYEFFRGSFRRGYLIAENGMIVEEGEGPCPEPTDIKVALFPGAVNAHTHCADYGLEVPDGLSIEELVAPPDGLKHKFLASAPPEFVSDCMQRFAADSFGYGAATFIDFREGGAEGCRLLRESVPDAMIMGRPISKEFDPEEMEALMLWADGIGLPSVSDMPMGYVEAVADFARERKVPFALHASERVREDIDFILSLDPAFIVHMSEADDSDFLKCAEAEVPIVVCPGSNAYFGIDPPLARMEACGVTMALGTDNGMLRVPDLAAEANLFVRAMAKQGGDSASVFGTFSSLNSKLLNQNIRISEAIQGQCLAVPFEGEPSAESIFRVGAPSFPLTRKRGGLHGVQEHTRSH